MERYEVITHLLCRSVVFVHPAMQRNEHSEKESLNSGLCRP